MKFKKPPESSPPQSLSDSNFHRIAISNLEDTDRKIARWWSKKYRTPLKDFQDHTSEELLIEMLEDHYENHPSEISRFFGEEEDWDGSTSLEYERMIQKRLGGRAADLSKYQDHRELSEEEEKSLLDNLGKNLPKSRAETKEFVETFEV